MTIYLTVLTQLVIVIALFLAGLNALYFAAHGDVVSFGAQLTVAGLLGFVLPLIEDQPEYSGLPS